MSSIARFVLLLLITGTFPLAADDPPNIVMIVADDLGFADLHCQGAPYPTPHLDSLAAAGTRFTDFYVAQPVCTASRAGFLTGCYPNRVSLQGALNHTSRNGIHPDEQLLPELLRQRGYATALIGKWHLGTAPDFHPLKHGFDQYFGIPYSNDNSRYHPVLSAEMPPRPLYDGLQVVERDPDQSQDTRRFTERAVSFMQQHARRPFFLYVPHVMPHVPIFASEAFRGRSGAGRYGDVVQELAWCVGEILRTLEALQLQQNTIVILFSDNGAWLSYGEHAGSNRPFREGKLTVFEGGVRVPCLMSWPGRIPAGRVCAEPVISLDLLPTLLTYSGIRQPDRPVDGLPICDLLEGVPNAKAPHEALYFWAGDELQAVRSGRWKLHLPHPYITTLAEPGRNGKPSGWGSATAKAITQSGIDGIASRHGGRIEQLPLSLFDLQTDPGEQHNVAREHPEIVARLTGLADRMRRDLGDSLTGIQGTGVRPAGLAAEP
ncbi:MAG: sulfatase-like hydrolase/transferase [Planctomyces sp.]